MSRLWFSTAVGVALSMLFVHRVSLHAAVHERNAVAELFQLSTVPPPSKWRQLNWVLTILTIACLLLALITWWSLLHGTAEDVEQTPSMITDTLRHEA